MHEGKAVRLNLSAFPLYLTHNAKKFCDYENKCYFDINFKR